MKCLRYGTIHSLKSRDFNLVLHHNTKTCYLYLKIIQTRINQRHYDETSNLFHPKSILLLLEMPQMMNGISYTTSALWTCCCSRRALLIHSDHSGHCMRFAFDLGEYCHHLFSVGSTNRTIS